MPKKRNNEADISFKIEEARQRYAVQNPEFAVPMSERARKIYISVFHDENGKPLPMRAIAQNAVCFGLLVDAVVPQLEKNADWQTLLRQAELQEPGIESAQGEAEVARPRQIACDEKKFRATKPSFKKTVAEIVTDETELMDYSNEDHDTRDFHDLSDITISPNRINDTLLKNLGLSRYLPPKRSSRATKMAAYKDAIPEIREMLSHLEPLTLPNEEGPDDTVFFRLMRIGKGSNAGELLGTQHINGDRDKKIFFRTDLNRADRRIDRIREKYSREIRKLIGKFKSTIEDIDRKVAGNWVAVRDSEDLEVMKQELFDLVDDLKFVSNEYKCEIRDILSKCAAFKTTRMIAGRVGLAPDGTRFVKRPEQTKEVYNPGAMRSMWNKAKRLIGPRLDQIARIESYLAKDRIRIEDYISEQEAPFNKFYDMAVSRHAKFRTLDLTRPLTQKDVSAMCTELVNIRASLLPADGESGGESGKKGITFEPYASFAKRMATHVDKLIALCQQPENINQQENRRAAASEMLNMYLVTKIQHFFREFQQFYGEYLSPDHTPYFVAVRDRLKNLSDVIHGKQLDEKDNGKLIKTTEYNEAFKQIYLLLARLRALSANGIEAKRKNDDESAKRIKKEMHDLASNFSFRELMSDARFGI